MAETLTDRDRAIIREALDFYAEAADDSRNDPDADYPTWERINEVGLRIARHDKITLRNEGAK